MNHNPNEEGIENKKKKKKKKKKRRRAIGKAKNMMKDGEVKVIRRRRRDMSQKGSSLRSL